MVRWQVCPCCGEIVEWPLALGEDEEVSDFAALLDHHPNDPVWLDGFEP